MPKSTLKRNGNNTNLYLVGKGVHTFPKSVIQKVNVRTHLLRGRSHLSSDTLLWLLGVLIKTPLSVFVYYRVIERE